MSCADFGEYDGEGEYMLGMADSEFALLNKSLKPSESPVLNMFGVVAEAQ